MLKKKKNTPAAQIGLSGDGLRMRDENWVQEELGRGARGMIRTHCMHV